MSDLVEKKMEKKTVKRDDETEGVSAEEADKALAESMTSSIEEELNGYGKRFVKQITTFPPGASIVEDSGGRDFMRDVGRTPTGFGFTNECTKPFKEHQKQTNRIFKALAGSAITYKEDVVCFTVKKKWLIQRCC